jgi:cyclase
MLKKRIIPCLDILDGRTVKGIQFKNLIDAGDPVELASRYEEEGADELVFLDISATAYRSELLPNLVKKIGQQLRIPFTVGGGIKSVQQAYAMLRAGADKIAVNSAAVRNPALIEEIAREFGSQCVVAAVDYRLEEKQHCIYVAGGREKTDLTLKEWLYKLQELGAGEFLLTSMNHDGEKKGFDCQTLKSLSEELSIPIIASGGAGSMEHFSELFDSGSVSAALAASVFHFREIPIPKLKSFLSQQKIPVR